MIFFGKIAEIFQFVSRATKQMANCDEKVKHESRTLNSKEYLDKIIEGDGMDSVTTREISGLLKHLNCPEFLYLLENILFDHATF